MKKVHAFKEDMAPQMILLMGLPAAGKSTFVKTNLIKFYNHRMPHLTSMQVLNSDVQLRRMQYERAREDFERLQGLEKQAYEAVIKDMTYKSNEGKDVSFTLPYEQFVGLKFNDFFKRMYKEYYATFFGDRGKAKKSTDELALKKIQGGDVVILDSVGTTTDKMLKYFEMGKKKGYTTSVVFLEIDPEISVARDLYRGQTEGRSVGEGVIRSYEPKLKPAWQVYFKSPMVDRLLHFRWIPASPTDVVKGKYKLVKDLKRYGAGRGTKPAAEPQAASTHRSITASVWDANTVNKLIHVLDGKVDALIQSALQKAGRRGMSFGDLDKALRRFEGTVLESDADRARKLFEKYAGKPLGTTPIYDIKGHTTSVKVGAAKPVGKPQQAIMDYLRREGPTELSDFTSDPVFRGVHFQRIDKAVDALEKEGLVKRSGTEVSLAKTRGTLRRAIIGTLLRAGRRDLAQAVAAHHRGVKKKSVQAARKLDNRTRQRVNADLSKAGLDGNGRFRRIGEALNVIAKVLSRHGIQQDQVFSANLFRDDHGQRTFDVAFSNPADSFSPEAISNSMLVIQWQQLRPDTFEVLSYLS